MSGIQACPVCGGQMRKGGIRCVSCYRQARKAAAEARRAATAVECDPAEHYCPFGLYPHANGYPVDGPCLTHYAELRQRGYWAARHAERLKEAAP